MGLLELKSWAIIALLEVDGRGEPLEGDGEIRPIFGGHAFVRDSLNVPLR